MNKKYYRIVNCMNKAINGEDITVSFIGGSITQGSRASTHEKSYAYLVYEWWVEKFPDVQVKYINAGIGGTDSYYGNSRVEKDVLVNNPDMLFVDFCVNDASDLHHKESFEGLIRKILKAKPYMGVMSLNNISYDTGINAENHHKKILDYYNIPYVSMYFLYEEIADGRMELSEISEDGLHPNDKGHRMIADTIIKLLDYIYGMVLSDYSYDKFEDVPEVPITLNRYEHISFFDSYMLSNRILDLEDKNSKISLELDGFYEDLREKKDITDLFKSGYSGINKNSKIRISVDAATFAIQYRKTINKPAPVAYAYIDGDKTNPVVLDGNFNEDWGDCLFLQELFAYSTAKKHEIEIEIVQGEDLSVENKYNPKTGIKTPFYITGFVL